MVSVITAYSMSCPLALSLLRLDAICIVNTRQRAHTLFDAHLDDH
jgi:hypothetical protein